VPRIACPVPSGHGRQVNIGTGNRRRANFVISGAVRLCFFGGGWLQSGEEDHNVIW